MIGATDPYSKCFYRLRSGGGVFFKKPLPPAKSSRPKAHPFKGALERRPGALLSDQNLIKVQDLTDP